MSTHTRLAARRTRHRELARGVLARVLLAAASLSSAMLCGGASGAEYTLVAQASPSWAPADNRGSSLPRSPNTVNRTAANPNLTGATVNQPPKDRDCKATITQPDAPYEAHPTKWNTDGTEDHGLILNSLGGAVRAVKADLNDMQVRVEQLRCEEQNIKAKLDYIIRRLP